MSSFTIKHLLLSLQRWGCTNPVFRSVDPQHPTTKTCCWRAVLTPKGNGARNGLRGIFGVGPRAGRSGFLGFAGCLEDPASAEVAGDRSAGTTVEEGGGMHRGQAKEAELTIAG